MSDILEKLKKRDWLQESGSVWALATEAIAEIERLQRALNIAAGVLSTTEGFTDKHPEEVREWILTQADDESGETVIYKHGSLKSQTTSRK